MRKMQLSPASNRLFLKLLPLVCCLISAPLSTARSHHVESHAKETAHGQTPAGTGQESKLSLDAEASRKIQNLKRQQAGASMPLWLPSWWAVDLDSWQEFPGPVTNASEQYFGQDEEDRYLVEHFFAGKQHGTYLEMGGYNGLTFTNTLHAHRAYGWRGLLIEPSPEMFWQMVGNRPDDICIHAASCGDFRRVHFVDSGVTSGIFEVMSEKFKAQWHPGLDKESLPMIPCMPLSSMLAKFSVSHLDFWSLDVEGAELQVLQTFDFNAVKVNVVCIEADGHDPDKDKAVKDVMLDHGYIFHGHVIRNDWFVHPDFVPSQAIGVSTRST